MRLFLDLKEPPSWILILSVGLLVQIASSGLNRSDMANFDFADYSPRYSTIFIARVSAHMPTGSAV